jgi:integrase
MKGEAMTKRKRVTYTRPDGEKAERWSPGSRNRRNFDEENVLELPCRKQQYMVWDKGTGSVPGLHILISKHGVKTYRSMYRYPGDKVRHGRALGRVGVMTLAEAREACRQDQRKAWQGYNPKQVSPSMDFKSVFEEYVKEEQSGNVTAQEMRRVVLNYTKDWHDRPVASIRPEEIGTLIRAIKNGDPDKGIRPKPPTANKMRGHLKTFFSWCADPEVHKLPVSPMAGMKKRGEKTKSRDRVYDDDEIKRLWVAADKIGGLEGPILKLALLTGKRRGHLVAMRWDELEEKSDGLFWNAPPGVKFKRNHPVPLSKLAARVLKGIKRDGAHVFPGRFEGTLLGAGTKMQQRVQEASGIDDWFLHACRHTVETGMAALKVLPHIRDLVLDHAPARGAGQGYDHYTYEPEMRAAAELWADHIERVALPSGVKALR